MSVFTIDWAPRGRVTRAAFAFAKPILERVSGLTGLGRVYEARPEGLDGPGLAGWTLDHLGIEVRMSRADEERIPAEGPVVVVANHPFGGVEGLALLHTLTQVRPDVRVLANFLLQRIPELKWSFLPVDPFRARSNAKGLRESLAWLRAGGLLVVFPAGEVASLDLRARRVADPAWSATVAGLVRRSEATVVPLFIPGRNGATFQAAGLVHPLLRTALLPRALLARSGKPIELRVGTPIPASRLADLGDDNAIGYLRDRTEILSGRTAPVQPRRTPDHAEPIVPPVPAALLAEEVASLPADARLVEADGLDVYVARAASIPNVLREIGRLRETTFRDVGEGTGRSIDLDEFDRTYLHLFVWNREAKEVVGAYRLGLTDELLAAGGVDALYTATLFRYDAKLFEAMGPAIEMGRSWVRTEYQRSYAGLMLLWKGIGEFVARSPRHATLFGPVSISAEYRSLSQQLIVAFLERNRKLTDWARWVRPTNPFRPGRGRTASVSNLEDVSTFISEIEADQKGIPILLKQYLKLDGRLLSYNVDPDFSGVLDVLIVVDLRRTREQILLRYLGKEGLAAFRAHHAGDRRTTQAS